MTTYTEKCSPSITEQAVGTFANPTRILRDWLKNQQLKAQVALERRQLSEMSASQLKDIGVSRYDADIEAQRKGIPADRI